MGCEHAKPGLCIYRTNKAWRNAHFGSANLRGTIKKLFQTRHKRDILQVDKPQARGRTLELLETVNALVRRVALSGLLVRVDIRTQKSAIVSCS